MSEIKMFSLSSGESFDVVFKGAPATLVLTRNTIRIEASDAAQNQSIEYATVYRMKAGAGSLTLELNDGGSVECVVPPARLDALQGAVRDCLHGSTSSVYARQTLSAAEMLKLLRDTGWADLLTSSWSFVSGDAVPDIVGKVRAGSAHACGIIDPPPPFRSPLSARMPRTAIARTKRHALGFRQHMIRTKRTGAVV